MKTISGLKYKVKFILEKRKDKTSGKIITEDVPILMVVSWNSERIMYHIGHRVDVTKWTDNTKEGEQVPYMKKNTVNKAKDTAATVNLSIRDHLGAVDEIFHEAGKIYPSKDELRELIISKTGKIHRMRSINGKDMLDFFQRYIEEADVSPIRKENLKTTLKHFKIFLQEKKIPPVFPNCTPQVLDDFRRYLRLGKGLGRTGKGGKPLKTHPRSKNTVSVILTRLRAFFFYATREGWTKTNPFSDFKIEKQVYGDPILLTLEERDKLFYAHIENNSLARTRDLFILQCFIGVRYGDLIKLKKENVIDDTVQYIAGKTKNKSRRVITVPLTAKPISIIEKYDIPNGDLLPYMSDQKYNKYLKQLFRMLELDRKVVWLNPKTGNQEIRPLYELASSHMARRTFVGLQFKAGVKNELIARMSGHTEGSQAFRRYYNMEFEDLRTAVQTIS